MEKRFKIGTFVENGNIKYKIFDFKTGQTVHCSIGEINQTIYKMMEDKL